MINHKSRSTSNFKMHCYKFAGKQLKCDIIKEYLHFTTYIKHTIDGEKNQLCKRQNQVLL